MDWRCLRPAPRREADDHASAARILFRHFPDYFNRPARGLPDDFLSLAYPRPFWGHGRRSGSRARRGSGVARVAHAAGSRASTRPPVPPWAPSACSRSLPYTAEALAERAGVGDILAGGIDDAELAEPRVNIAIAARLNADLLEMFDGAPPAGDCVLQRGGRIGAGDWWAATRGPARGISSSTASPTPKRATSRGR